MGIRSRSYALRKLTILDCKLQGHPFTHDLLEPPTLAFSPIFFHKMFRSASKLFKSKVPPSDPTSIFHNSRFSHSDISDSMKNGSNFK